MRYYEIDYTALCLELKRTGKYAESEYIRKARERAVAEMRRAKETKDELA